MNGSAFTIRMGAALWQRVRDHHLAPDKRIEALSYAWARCERVLGGWVVLLPADSPWFAFQPDCYENQAGGNVRLRPDVLNGMLIAFAGSGYNCLVNIHDHWFADQGVFSSVDDEDDVRFDRYLRQRFEPMLAAHPEIGASRPIYNLSLVLGKRATGARVLVPQGRCTPISSMTISDERWNEAALSSAHPASGMAHAPVHARHRTFIDAGAQNTLGLLKVAIVGCGGLGSILAESLGRLGIRHFRLIDDDRLDLSNLNRWQGARPVDVGIHKSRLLGRAMRRQFPDCAVRPLVRALDHPHSVAAIAGSDVVFGCLDNDAARWYLNHIAVQFMVPYFDAGVSIVAGPPVELSTRYFAVLPQATGCLDCKGVELVDPEAVLAAFLSPQTTTERRNAGYVSDLPRVPAPSAYVLNQRAAGLMATEFCNFVTGWRKTATVAYEHWNAGATCRLDRDTFPERPLAGCPVCGVRTGRGYSLDLPHRPNTVHVDPADLPTIATPDGCPTIAAIQDTPPLQENALWPNANPS